MAKRRLLITGASSEAGLALLRKLTPDSYDEILFHYCHASQSLTALFQETSLPIVPLAADFSDEESTDAFVRLLKQDYPEISHFVHLPAAKLAHQKFKKAGWTDFDAGYRLSVGSAVKILKLLLPSMSRQKYGKVVFMLSAVTKNTPPGYLSDYVTVKYALTGLMKALSAEYSGHRVNINGVSPHMMDTSFLSDIPEAVVSHMMEANPGKNPVRPESAADVILFLLSPASDSLFGQNLLVSDNGG